MKNLLIAASGTGGHIFPALAIAESLPIGWEIYWLGVTDRLDIDLVPRKYHLKTIRAGGLQGSFLNKIVNSVRLIIAIKSTVTLIKDRKIDVIFTTGGYIAAPTIVAARLCGIKVILHESNAFPGKVTRFMGRFANLIALGFPTADKYLKGCKTIFTGTPVRKDFYVPQQFPAWAPFGLGPLIVILGGSQGAVGLNRMVKLTIKHLLNENCRIVHVTGEIKSDQFRTSNPNYVARSFSKEIASLFQHAELVISRAGAGTISELAICGTPAILVPFPYSSDDHQDFNASCIAEFGGALLIHEHSNSQRVLLKSVLRLLGNKLRNNDQECNNYLANMRQEMRSFSASNSSKKLVQIVVNSVSKSL
ncbi:undecaprenyldiphospho-muramoylpentapeptide beta-N-acetylglucosaminyltransferase [Prochlorococcus sp. MIT 1223]|uniref:undecaprenyldiphospho-muramoylpentapeptide beta-N-acetylglucosaminyltransferase n=1 Tax=Prochlorococcus sp. MIT 1223 TaxID=3096217 RepID=UPI002A7635CD|nr:undecaprenyldiphospho-muramoylpentapeptide beta-N-acetylglucosaminyltransferase [Prochlorococcus sp. MIT 1223]